MPRASKCRVPVCVQCPVSKTRTNGHQWTMDCTRRSRVLSRCVVAPAPASPHARTHTCPARASAPALARALGGARARVRARAVTTKRKKGQLELANLAARANHGKARTFLKVHDRPAPALNMFAHFLPSTGPLNFEWQLSVWPLCGLAGATSAVLLCCCEGSCSRDGSSGHMVGVIATAWSSRRSRATRA